MEKIELLLILERDKRGLIWGRINYDEDLIVDSDRSQRLLEDKMREHLRAFHKLNPENVRFEIFWES